MSEWTISLGQIDRVIKQQDLTCICGTPISESVIKCYPHPDGIPVSGYHEKQWVYFHCPKCGNDAALWKLLNKALHGWTRGIECEALEELMEKTRRNED